jgi:hypothetical protein
MMASRNDGVQKNAMGQFLTRLFDGYTIEQRVDDGFIDLTALFSAYVKQIPDTATDKARKRLLNRELRRYNATKRAHEFKICLQDRLRANNKSIQVRIICCYIAVWL